MRYFTVFREWNREGRRWKLYSSRVVMDAEGVDGEPAARVWSTGIGCKDRCVVISGVVWSNSVTVCRYCLQVCTGWYMGAQVCVYVCVRVCLCAYRLQGLCTEGVEGGGACTWSELRCVGVRRCRRSERSLECNAVTFISALASYICLASF